VERGSAIHKRSIRMKCRADADTRRRPCRGDP
jgi:hypothetical protein